MQYSSAKQSIFFVQSPLACTYLLFPVQCWHTGAGVWRCDCHVQCPGTSGRYRLQAASCSSLHKVLEESVTAIQLAAALFPFPAVDFQHVYHAQTKLLLSCDWPRPIFLLPATHDHLPSPPFPAPRAHRSTSATCKHRCFCLRPAAALLHDHTTSAWQPCQHHCRVSPFSSACAVCVPIMDGGRPSSACSSSQEALGLLAISNAAGTLTDRQAWMWWRRVLLALPVTAPRPSAGQPDLLRGHSGDTTACPAERVGCGAASVEGWCSGGGNHVMQAHGSA